MLVSECVDQRLHQIPYGDLHVRSVVAVTGNAMLIKRDLQVKTPILYLLQSVTFVTGSLACNLQI